MSKKISDEKKNDLDSINENEEFWMKFNDVVENDMVRLQVWIDELKNCFLGNERVKIVEIMQCLSEATLTENELKKATFTEIIPEKQTFTKILIEKLKVRDFPSFFFHW